MDYALPKMESQCKQKQVSLYQKNKLKDKNSKKKEVGHLRKGGSLKTYTEATSFLPEQLPPPGSTL